MSERYCCYCLMPKGDRYMCCLENHFMEFDDLPEEDRQTILGEQGND